MKLLKEIVTAVWLAIALVVGLAVIVAFVAFPIIGSGILRS